MISILDLSPNNTSCSKKLSSNEADLLNHYWLQNKQGMHWIENGCPVRPLPSEQMRECFTERFHNRITVIGDSHVLYLYYYLVHLIDPKAVTQAGKTHKDRFIKSYRYLWTTFAETFHKKIRNLVIQLRMTQNKSANGTELIVLHCGSWDLANNGSVSIMSKAQNLIKSIKWLQSKLTKYNIKRTIIWQNQPSYPSTGSFKDRYWRNSYVIGAVNNWICNQLSLIDVPCIDAWTITQAWQEDPVCTDHMLCAEKTKFTGVGGMAAAHKLIQHLCSTYM